MCEIGYKWKDIAALFMVSRWTLFRRLKERGLESITEFSDVSDEELGLKMKDFKELHGSTVGRSLALGYLRQCGLRVQQEPVAKALARVDPENSRLRWAALIKRQKYSVPGPNSFWHADWHHNLISWGLVIHEAIGGYSRQIVYLHSSTNNNKGTVLKLFEEAIIDYGGPSRIQTAKGGENTLIWELMVKIMGNERGSFLSSSSIHNQRI